MNNVCHNICNCEGGGGGGGAYYLKYTHLCKIDFSIFTFMSQVL